MTHFGKLAQKTLQNYESIHTPILKPVELLELYMFDSRCFWRFAIPKELWPFFETRCSQNCDRIPFWKTAINSFRTANLRPV